jgi:hypothetical protein
MTARPRLCLSLGVTGHREANLRGADLDALRSVVAGALAQAEAALQAVARQHTEAFDAASPRLRLLSALADGADSLVAHAALERGWRLDACLPFAREEYAADFDAPQLADYEALLARSDAVFELPGQRADVEAAYESVGRLILDQCDLLIALWDGDRNRGRGGTSYVVAEAVARQVPVLHIHTSGSQPPQILWSGLGIAELDQPTVETVPRAALQDMLPQVVAALTEPPQPEVDRRMLQRFYSEPATRSRPPLTYTMLLAAAGVRRLTRRDLQPLSAADGARAIRAPLASDRLDAGFLDPIAGRYGVADLAGSHFAQLFRSGFVANYLLAGFAVVLALSGLLAPALKLPLILAELACVMLIIANTQAGRRLGWHERWMDNRHLAEQLRSLAMSSVVGDLALRSTLGTRDAAAVPGWVAWLVRATARETGLPQVRVDEGYLREVHQGALRLVDEQLGYHRANAARMHKLEHRLHRAGEVLFGATVAGCLGWITFKLGGLPMGVKGKVGLTEIVTFATVAMPALGSAIYGVRMQGDFAGAAYRSQVTVERLERLRQAMAGDPMEHARLLARLRNLSDIMTNDIGNWRTTFKARPLTLPG